MGSGNIASEVVINEVTQGSVSNNVSSDSSSNRARSTYTHVHTPQRRTAPNDGRNQRHQRPRHYNSSSSLHLPPSTSATRAININRLEHGYSTIAESINNLAYQQRIRTRIDINKDIQQYVQIRSDLERSGADSSVLEAYNDTISDLREERVLAGDYERYVSSRVRSMLDTSISNSSAFDDNGNSTSLDDTDNNEE